MAFPGRAHHVPVWVNPPPPGAEEYTPVAMPSANYMATPTAGFYTGHNTINAYNCTPNANYYAKENDYTAHDRFNANAASGSNGTRYTRRSETPSPPRCSKSRHNDKASKERSRDPYSPDRARSRYTATTMRRRSPSRERRRSRSNSRYRRNRSRSSSRWRYRRSRSSSRGKYNVRHRRSKSGSRSRTYSNTRGHKSTRSRSPTRSSSRSYSCPATPNDSDASTSPSSHEAAALDQRSTTSDTLHLGTNQLKTFDILSHKQFINRRAQKYTTKTQQAIHDASNTFKNDGSFLEMFKKLQEEKDKKVEKDKDCDKPEKILNIVAAANSLLDSSKAPTMPLVSKRRGGRILKTGVVEKKRLVVPEEQPKDAWAVYMKEVKRYKEACCDDDSKTRSLVK